MAMAIGYAIYYGLNILWDILRKGGKPTGIQETETLFISGDPEPPAVVPHMDPEFTSPLPANGIAPQRVDVGHPPIGVIPESPGAVPIRQLFELAKNEMIEFSHSIPY